MNQPAYQDWSKYSVPSADTLDSGQVAPTSSYTGLTTDCSTWKYLHVVVQNFDLNIYHRVGMTWGGYNNTLLPELANEMVIGPNMVAPWVIPIRGRTFKFSFNALNGAPTDFVYYEVTGMSHYMSKYDSQGLTLPLARDISAYTSGQGKTFTFTKWYEGYAQVTCGTSGGFGGFVSFQYWDEIALNWTEFATLGFVATNSSIPQRIMMPAAPVRASVNNGGTAQTIGFEVTPALD
jgi:hypothetical protein